MKRRYLRGGFIALLFFQGLIGPAEAQQDTKWQRILIKTRKPYDGIVRAVEASGGHVTQQFEYIDAIAAEVLEETVVTIGKLPGVQGIIEDVTVQGPASINPIRTWPAGQAQGTGITIGPTVGRKPIPSGSVKELAATQPQIYSINNAGTRIESLHAMGLTGNGVIVAVIDSGMRSGFDLAAEAVIGGADFFDDGAPGPAGDGQADWKKAGNDGHGTFAAGLIAGKTSFLVNGVMQSALQQYAPGAIVNGELPLIGTAPDARIYAVRVYQDPFVGAPLSAVMAAMDHVTKQRDLYNNNEKKGLKIEVANVSLGFSTLAAGESELDELLDAMLDVGIVPVVSAGNVGPSAITIASPGTSRSGVTVGAANPAANERILFEVQYATQHPEEYYPGVGRDLRPFDGTEIDWSSARGPNADGRLDPDIVATGVGNISQGYCPDQTEVTDACFNNLSIGSGTSFSAPIVSGIAAVLMGAFPNAGATRIRNALIAAGNTGNVEPYFDAVDRGNGLVDAYAAYLLLNSGTVPGVLPQFTPPLHLPVESNIEQNPGLIVESGTLTEIMSGLKPGERGEILYTVPPDTDRVIVRIRNVEMTGPQNPFFGTDRMFLYVHSAKTSRARGNYLVEGELFVGGEAERVFELTNPDTGVMRVTVNPDTLNGGLVNATVRLQTIPRSFPSTRVIDGTIGHKAIKTYTHDVDAKTKKLEFVLTWDHDWAHYPTSDVDLIVCSPDIPAADCRTLGNKQAATLASPERVTIEQPGAGTWTLLVNGFSVPTFLPLGNDFTDNFRIRIRETP
jgi:hypothetical protein